MAQQIDVRAEDVDVFRQGYKTGFETARRIFAMADTLTDFEALRKLSAGSLIKDARGKILFRTTANGWVSVTGTHFASMYVPLPVEVLFRG